MTKQIKLCIVMTVLLASAGAMADVTVKTAAKAATISNAKVAVTFNLATGNYSVTDKATGKTMVRDAWFRLDPGTRSWRTPPYKYTAEDRGATTHVVAQRHKLAIARTQ